MGRSARPSLLPHLGALAGVVGAVVLTWLCWPLMEHNPLLFFLVAVAVSTWYGGLRPGLTATAGSVAALYVILLDTDRGLLLDGYNAGRLGLFALACLLLSWFSERHQAAERARQRIDRTFGELFESASEAIIIAEEQGHIVRANAAAETMFGYRREQMIGQPIELLIPPSARERHVQHRAAYMSQPRNRPMGRGMDLLACRKDGSEFPVEISLSHVRDGEQMRVMSFITDISERKEAEASLARYQEQLRQLAFESVKAEQRERRQIAVELHDRIGQALALCQIKLGGLQPHITGPAADELSSCIALVQHAVDDTRSLTFELSPPVLYDLGLKAAVLWLADQMREEHCFEVAVEAEPLPSLDDELAALLFRSVRELLMNAVKHAQVAQATVRLDCTAEGLRIEVADDGIGFDLAATRRRRASEAGFGLLSIYEQIERVGGAVNIDAAPGRGTRVCITVPLPGATEQPMEEKASATDGDARVTG
ncbi:MAG: PAS domain S-box protein [Phycisphaeraceae bacterium]